MSSLPPPPPAVPHSLLASLFYHILPPTYPIPTQLLSQDLQVRHVYLPPSGDGDDGWISQRPATTPSGSGPVSTRLEEIAQENRGKMWSDDVQILYQVRDVESVLARIDLSSKSGSSVRVALQYEGEAGWRLHDTSLILDTTTTDQGWSNTIAQAWEANPAAARGMAEAGDSSGAVGEQVSLGEDEDDGMHGQDEGGSGAAGDAGYWDDYSDDGDSKAEVVDDSQIVNGSAPPSKDLPTITTTDLPSSSKSTTNANPSASPNFVKNHQPLPKFVTPDFALPSRREPFVASPSSTADAATSPLRHLGSGAVSRLATPDESYWALYGSVEDGLKTSNPPTPGGYETQGAGGGWSSFSGGIGSAGLHMSKAGAEGRKGMHEVEEDKEYWGTGGEAPVSWSPPTRKQSLPPIDNANAQEPTPVPGQELSPPTTEPPTVRPTPEVASAAIFGKANGVGSLNARQKALAKTLEGLKEMYLAQGGAAGELDGEFKQVLKGLL